MSDELRINTPASLVQCQNVTIAWSGGVGMYLHHATVEMLTVKHHITRDTWQQVLLEVHPRTYHSPPLSLSTERGELTRPVQRSQ